MFPGGRSAQRMYRSSPWKPKRVHWLQSRRFWKPHVFSVYLRHGIYLGSTAINTGTSCGEEESQGRLLLFTVDVNTVEEVGGGGAQRVELEEDQAPREEVRLFCLVCLLAAVILRWEVRHSEQDL